MPFINISFGEAKRSLEDTSLIYELLKQKKINPKEGDLLEKLGKYVKTNSTDILDEIKQMCEQYFGQDGKDAFNKLSRFVESENKRVAWVIFSRHYQSIKYDDRDPLEDYTPRVSEVLTINSKYRLVE
ncbi:MAG: hypothetical protein ACTSR2_14685 [Candidatus Hodarchaeales archaeon]